MRSKLLILATLLGFVHQHAAAQQKWVVGYWSDWDHSPAGVKEILAQRAFTHLIHFAVGVNASGDIVEGATQMLSVQAAQLVPLAHAASTKVLFCVFPHQPDVVSVLSPAHRHHFVNSICNVIRSCGYDGVDFDYEDGFTAGLDIAWGETMAILRDSLNSLGKILEKPLYITVFTFGASQGSWYPSSPYVDRFSLAGYEMAGPWGGYPVWHGYCLHSRGLTLLCCPDRTNGNMDSLWAGWIRRGIPASKLMLGNSTGAGTWTGGLMTRNLFPRPNGFVTGNGALRAGDWWEDIGGQAPSFGSGDNLNYHDIITGPLSSYPTLHDTIAVASYKSIDKPGNVNDQFISFADPWVWWKDYEFVRNHNGGGLMMWNGWRGRIWEGYWPLVNAVKLSVEGKALPPVPSGSLTVYPDTLPYGGGKVTLRWKSQDATSVTLSPSVGSALPAGTATATIQKTTTVVLSLSNATWTIPIAKSVVVRNDPSNLALGRPASASSEQAASLLPTNANDGNTETRWGSNYSNNQWWQVDLGAQMTVNRIVTNWENAFASQFKVSLSSDGASFIDVATVNITTPGVHETRFPGSKARFVRIVCVTRATIYGFSLWEVGVFGSSALPKR